MKNPVPGQFLRRRELDMHQISDGSRTFETDGIVVKPAAVIFDPCRNRLLVSEHALMPRHSEPARIDEMNARLSGYVVHTELTEMQKAKISIYIHYPGNCQVEIDFETSETRKLITAWHNREARRITAEDDDRAVVACGPLAGPVLAYCLVNFGTHRFSGITP